MQSMNLSINPLSSDLASKVFSHFTNHTAQGIFILDLQTYKILYINPAGQELLDLKKHNEHKSLKYMLQAIHEDDRIRVIENIEIYLRENVLKDPEFRIRTAEGSIKWICLTLYCMEDELGEKRILFGFAEDVSIRKEYEIDLFKHNSKINSILNILAHDLREPFVNISMISGMLKEDHQNAEFNDAHNLTDMIDKICIQAFDMIKQYVNREFLKSSTIEIQKTITEVVERTRSIIDTFKGAHNHLNRIFKLEAFPNDKIWIELDDVKFLQIINNLISNAIKFTHEGSTIHIKLEEMGNSLLMAFHDNGIGIPEDLQPFLFDEFTKARRKGVRGEETVGLGLSITKKMIELHGGKIWFESREGVGTTFFISLPKS